MEVALTAMAADVVRVENQIKFRLVQPPFPSITPSSDLAAIHISTA